MDSDLIVNIAGVITALGIIIGAGLKIHKLLTRIETMQEHDVKIDKKLHDMEAEQCMQTYVLEAVLDGLHQLGCNGKTTEASEKLSKFINKKAHNQNDETI